MTRLLTAALSFSLLLPLAAQEARGPKVRLLAERVPAGLGKVELRAGELKGPAFDLTVNELTAPQEPPARAFKLYAADKNVALASVTLPEAGNSFVVLLVPATPAGYKSVVIAGADPSFKPGDVYFYNHADKPVLGFVGTAKFILPPGKGQTLRPAGATDNTFYNVGFGVREKEGDRALSSTRWPVDGKTRSYVFFFVNPETKRVDFRAVDEFIDPDKKEP